MQAQCISLPCNTSIINPVTIKITCSQKQINHYTVYIYSYIVDEEMGHRMHACFAVSAGSLWAKVALNSEGIKPIALAKVKLCLAEGIT